MISRLLSLYILCIAAGASVYEELAIFSLATSKGHGKPPQSLWDTRITPMHDTWGRLFPHLHLVFGTNVFDFNFLSRIQCQTKSNSSENAHGTVRRRRLLARTHQTRPRNEIIHYKCPLAAEREANVLWVGNCTGEYFGIGPTCRLQETMRWYVRSPAAAHLSATKWFIFIDDDLYFRPWGLVSFLAKVSSQKSLKNMAIISSNTSNEFAFSQRWQGKKNLDCSMLSNYFAQPVFIPRETLESTLLSAIDANGLVQLQQSWGGSADVILGLLFYIYETTLYSVSYSHIESLEQLLSEDLLDEATETFKSTPSLFIVHGLRRFKLRPPSIVDLEPEMLIKRKRLLEREFYTELSHTSVAKALGDEHPYSAEKEEEQKRAGLRAADLLIQLPQSAKPVRWDEKRKSFNGRFLSFTPQDCIVESKRRRLLHASTSSLTSGHVSHSLRLDSPLSWSSITTDKMWAEINRQVDCWSENGRWVRGRDPPRIVLRSCLQHVRYSEGACNNQTHANSSEPHQYHWHVEASKCSAPFHPWVAPKVPNHNGSIEHLCHMLAGHRLLVVGDSIQEEFYFTLMSAFGVERFDSGVDDCNPSGVRTVHCLSGGHDKSFRIAMVRNDNLSISASGQSQFDHLPWTQTLVELNTTILLVNTGAHYAADELFLSSVETAIAHVQKNWPQVLILFRSTPIGHLDHAKHFNDPPLADLPVPEAGHEYSYDKFAHQNSLVQSLIQKLFHRNVVYFDVYNSTSRRSDSHSQDPLHYCIPGPIDHWVRIFANVLRLVDSHNGASSGSGGGGGGSGVDKVSVAAAAIAHSPIERQWEQFSLYATSRCGAWMTEYTRLHREIVRDGPRQRVLVAMTGGQGATDRLAGHLTAFLIALASRRAFLIHPYSDALPFSSSFEYPSIDLGVPSPLKERVEMAWKSMNNHPNSVTKDLFNLSIVNFHDGHPIFTAPFNNSGNEAMSSYPVLFGGDAVVLFGSNRGNIYNLIGSSTMETSIELQKMGLQAKWGVHCAFHYLFRPNTVVLQMAQPFASKLVDDVVKIGIQIRTGDYANFWTRVQPAQFKEKNLTVSQYINWFKCAENIEKKHAANGKRVKWFLMSDSLSLRIDAKAVYDDKIVTDTHSHALHTGINRNEGSASMQRVMAELLTLSLCDYFVLTFNSGVGKLAAWISDNRDKNAFIVSPDEPQCKPYSDKDMALSNQGLR